MKSVSFGRPSESVCVPGKSREPTYHLAEGSTACPNLCGMCPACAFAPKPPCSTQSLWRVSDEFKRRFLIELLMRCKNVQVLESVQGVLGLTSWTLFTYARSRGPLSPQGFPSSRSHTVDRALEDGRPIGVDMSRIWDWFNSSPDWMKSRYLCRLFSRCDSELLRMVANLTSVLLVREKRGFLKFNVGGCRTPRRFRACDGDSEDPALMVVPGSSKSVSGVSRYRDFISCLPVDLSKRILGLLDEYTLKRCLKVCRYWQHLAHETMEDVKFRKIFQDQIKTMMKRSRGINVASSTYANIVEVPVPVEDDDKVDFQPSVQKGKPFEAAYARIKTKMVQMEERNVYCGAFFTKVLLNREDPQRVMDYRGGYLMATGSKNRVVNLLYVASETEMVSVLKGHVGGIRAVLLCPDKDLLITASCDASIRCWDIKTDRCMMMLYGHTGTVNCVDVCGDRLVSGAKDCLVKVWSLDSGKQLEEFAFKHASAVLCVRISKRVVYSSCDRGLVKIWDMEKAALARVIDAHKGAVKCLFFDEHHLLSGDVNGQVNAWSVNCNAKECLMTFVHPKEVKSLTLVHLRVVTGCSDGKIRIFNFLTGDCLRDITAETEVGRILSLHFHENSILVNSTYAVKRYQFSKVFWDYSESTEGGQGDVVAQGALVPQKPTVSVRKFPFSCSSPTSTKSRAREHSDSARRSVMLSEKATSERIRRRGLHHPLTRDSILLRVNATHKSQCADELGVNMEYNAGLRDCWDSRPTPRDPPPPPPQPEKARDGPARSTKTGFPFLQKALSAPDATRRNLPSVLQKKEHPHRAKGPRGIVRSKSFPSSSAEGQLVPEVRLTRSLCYPERLSGKSGIGLPRISPVGPFIEHGGFRLLTEAQIVNSTRAKSFWQKASKKDKK